MNRVLLFGATSRVGSEFVASTRLRIDAVGRRDPRLRGLHVESFRAVDLQDLVAVEQLVAQSDADAIVNFAAHTSVDAAERERLDPADAARSPAFVVNALAVEAMARGAAALGRPFLTFSTDFVFDGHRGPYTETDAPPPGGEGLGWDGYSKAEGERRARAAYPATIVILIAYPYGAFRAGGSDFARWIVAGHRSGRLPPLFTDQQITPTWVPDVGRALEHLLAVGGSGTYHVASPEPTTPHEFGVELLRAGLGTAPELPTGSIAEYLRRPGATPRPVRGGLAVGRLPAAGIALTSWRDGARLWWANGGSS